MMNLPKNGRIVVIDDKDEESLPLMRALSIAGCPFHYFSMFDPTNLPTIPFSDIRVVFLDLELVPRTGDAKAANTYSIFEKIVSKDNAPFIVIAWTTNSDLFEKVREYVIAGGFQASMIEMQKQTCISGGSYDLQKITSEIRRVLSQNDMRHLFNEWENAIHDSAGTTIRDFSSFFKFNQKWNENVASLFWKLAKARTDRQIENLSEDDVVTNALSTFTSTFLDTVESKTRRASLPSEVKQLIKANNNPSAINTDIDSQINSKLMYSTEAETYDFPGNLYENLVHLGIDKDSIIDHIAKIFTKEPEKTSHEVNKSKLKQNSKPIFLTVNALCDYAQDKWRTVRLVPGFTCPKDLFSVIKYPDDSIYRSPLVHYCNENCYLVFDLGSITSVPLNTISSSPTAVVRHEFLTDIQARLSHHVNRPGIPQL